VVYAFVFFFQAEDGIRDFHVTGVQTCALPICPSLWATSRRLGPFSCPGRAMMCSMKSASSKLWVTAKPKAPCQKASAGAMSGTRSEERRVGKECRSGWWAGHAREEGARGRGRA